MISSSSSSCAFRQLSMSRDGWMKKKANAGGDNGWAERVSITQRHVQCVCDDLLTLRSVCRAATWPPKCRSWTSSLSWTPPEKNRRKEHAPAFSPECLSMSTDTQVTHLLQRVLTLHLLFYYISVVIESQDDRSLYQELGSMLSQEVMKWKLRQRDNHRSIVSPQELGSRFCCCHGDEL